MKIDVVQKILGLDGVPVAEDATLRKVCSEALLNTLRGDENMDGVAKAKLFSLALAISAEDEPDLALEDWAKIKERIGRGFTPLIVGRAYELIDPTKPKAVEAA